MTLTVDAAQRQSIVPLQQSASSGLDNMLCLLILQKRGFSFIMETTKPNKALPKCKKETQHGNYNLCRNGCP